MHVLVKLFCLLMLTLALAFVNLQQIIWMSVVLVAAALTVDTKTLVSMMVRIRWLLLILALMYAFSTPGEYIPLWGLPLRPTYEGLLLGLTQLLKMVIMLTGLSVVLATTSRSMLIGGLYQLFLPLRCIGLDAERFAVRIWLTLYYAEIRKQTIRQHAKGLDFNQLFTLSEQMTPSTSQDRITIEVHRMKRRDYVLMLFIALYLLALGAM